MFFFGVRQRGADVKRHFIRGQHYATVLELEVFLRLHEFDFFGIIDLNGARSSSC